MESVNHFENYIISYFFPMRIVISTHAVENIFMLSLHDYCNPHSGAGGGVVGDEALKVTV